MSDQGSAAPAKPASPMDEKFAKANVTQDGRLTPEQAAGAMPMVAREFKAIDTGQKGYVTIEEVRAFRRKRMAGKAGGGKGKKGGGAKKLG